MGTYKSSHTFIRTPVHVAEFSVTAMVARDVAVVEIRWRHICDVTGMTSPHDVTLLTSPRFFVVTTDSITVLFLS